MGAINLPVLGMGSLNTLALGVGSTKSLTGGPEILAHFGGGGCKISETSFSTAISGLLYKRTAVVLRWPVLCITICSSSSSSGSVQTSKNN